MRRAVVDTTVLISSFLKFGGVSAEIVDLAGKRFVLVLCQRPAPVSGICRDPNDDVVLACAVAGEADCIVTRDQDLLSLRSYEGIDILPPEQFRHDLRAALKS
jgi:predicted nucleic acid-binding protein